MHAIHSSRPAVLGLIAMLSVVLLAPVDVRAEDHTIDAAPAMSASWDETSGYGSVELSRASISFPAAPAGIPIQVSNDVRWAPARTIEPATSVDASRVAAARQALLSDDLGSMQEDALMAVVDSGAPRDEMSGYGSVEAPRAVICEESASRPCRK